MTVSSSPAGPTSSGVVHLRAEGVSVIVRTADEALPSIVHWGADLGDLSEQELADLSALDAPLLDNTADEPQPTSIVPLASSGWLGAPGLQGHRLDGTAWSPSFDIVEHNADSTRLRSRARATRAGLGLDIELELLPTGLLRARANLTNAEDPYVLDRLVVTLPVPPLAAESFDQAGRWAKERVPQRREIPVGTHLRESRRGRTGADAATMLIAGERGFGFRGGEVWGVHVGWSGNHVSYLERHNNGRTLLGGGELLLPGEVVLAPGEGYTTPWVYGAYGVGLDEQASRVHAWLRSRPQHPNSERPVTLNVWEAVYFDHRLEPLLAIADHAAAVGVERFVLDDGWFRHRRSDDAGLGDWYVDEQVWPEGLHPLVSRVRELGMQFGLWFEPEMINADSDLARQHPEWIMQTDGRMPLEARHQQVLDVGNPEAYAYLLERISGLVDEYGIDYIKWDHNRDLLESGSPAHGGAAGVHAQTLAVYRLLAELKRRHTKLEIESCSSGGARVDLGILEFADRVWASDCIDPLERQQILRWTAQLLPPELVGNHVAGPESHTTGRRHDLSFRSITALFGHFGIEWNIADASEDERAELAEWVALHKKFRSLIHTGSVVRVDHPVCEVQVHGAVAPDADEALFSIALLGRPSTWPVGAVRIPGLEQGRRYRVSSVGPNAPQGVDVPAAPAWQRDEGVTVTGRTLANVGIPVPNLRPEQAALVHIIALAD